MKARRAIEVAGMKAVQRHQHDDRVTGPAGLVLRLEADPTPEEQQQYEKRCYQHRTFVQSRG
jgi:hypothetical protein